MDKVHIWCGRDGDWYWHRKAPNGRIIADGGGFDDPDNAKRSVESQYGESVEYIIHRDDDLYPEP